MERGRETQETERGRDAREKGRRFWELLEKEKKRKERKE